MVRPRTIVDDGDICNVVFSGIQSIVGTPADEVICGTAGDDIIDGGGGNDTILAGDGTDPLIFTSVAGPVEVDLHAVSEWS